MSLAWELALWAASRLEPHAKRLWKRWERHMERMSGTPEESIARWAAEKAAERTRRARAKWNTGERWLRAARLRDVGVSASDTDHITYMDWDSLETDVKRRLATAERED